MTTEHEASRTLVKSPPELWAECSDPGSLARHLGEFGEIRITRLEPENTVAWEGEHASGTVRIEPSGWGTRVTLTAQPKVEASDAPPETEAIVDAQPASSESESQTAEEDDHAAVEETVEDPEELPVADTGRARARWRRITSRMRDLFSAVEVPPVPEAQASVAPVAPVESPEPEVEVEAEPEASVEPQAEPEASVEPQAESEPKAVAEAVAPGAAEPPVPQLDAEAILASALESLGQAHHRPFSRA